MCDVALLHVRHMTLLQTDTIIRCITLLYEAIIDAITRCITLLYEAIIDTLTRRITLLYEAIIDTIIRCMTLLQDNQVTRYTIIDTIIRCMTLLQDDQVTHMTLLQHTCYYYGGATISRLLRSIGLFCRKQFFLQGSFAKETHDFKERTHRSQNYGSLLQNEYAPLNYRSLLQNSHTKETYKRDLYSQKRRVILDL